jgi:exo-beta-1,3-glucanase (GH17 family)
MYTRIRLIAFVLLFSHINPDLTSQPADGKGEFVKLKWINFSPYTQPGQNPNLQSKIEKAQIITLLDSLKSRVEGIRTFGTENGLEDIPFLAKQRGFRVIVGIWIGSDITSNSEQISGGINIANAGYADRIIVGSEVLLRNELTANKIVEYINQVKQACPGIPVSYADIVSVLSAHPEIIDACDFVSPNIYPLWEGFPIECAINRFHQEYKSLKQKVGNKEIFISESGWKTNGPMIGDALPSIENAVRYDRQLLIWSKSNGIEVNLFTAFDEPWKLPDDDGWGIFYNNAILKEGMDTLFKPTDSIDSTWLNTYIRSGTDTLSIDFIPPMESFDNIRGHTNFINPNMYKIVCYIKVGYNWWVKPYAGNPSVPIQCNGNWQLDYTTGGIDQLATQICIYLVPADYTPNFSDINQKSIASKCITRCPLPYTPVTTDQDIIHVGETATLTAGNGSAYLWSTGEKTQVIQVSPANTTNYFVMSTTAAGCVETSSRVITVLKSDQTISFNPIQKLSFGSAPFQLTASSSSGLAITYTSSDTGVAIITGNTVTLTGTGTTEITASQEGNAYYNTAESVVQTLTVVLSTDIKKTSVNSVNLFPNPNNGNFILQLGEEFNGDITIRISNIMGYLIKSITFNKPSAVITQGINIESIPGGIYFISLQSKEQCIVKRVVVR